VSSGAVRLISKAPEATNSQTILLVLLFLVPIFSPIAAVNAEARIEADDFEILDDLSNVLANRQNVLDSNSVDQLANPQLESVRNGITPTGPADPLYGVEGMLDQANFVDTTPPTPVHPGPYELLTNPDSAPPGDVTTVWATLFNLTDYVIWTKYVDQDGNVHEEFEIVTFTVSLLSLFNPDTDFLLHAIDVDNDGDDDIQVGLKVGWDFSNGWGIEGDTLWIQPSIEYTVKVLDSSASDSDWNNLDTLEVSLMKAFGYSEGILTEGESYVWVVDSSFTTKPNNFAIKVGFERVFFDLSNAGTGLVTSLFSMLSLGLLDLSADESDISLIGISSPYSIRVVNDGQSNCPSRYSPIELTTLPSNDITCGVTVGLGYVHFSAPDIDGDRDVWEVAYIEVAIHPNGVSTTLPNDVEIVIRTDSTLADGTGLGGEDALTTIEYWADRRADIHVHFHEDRSGAPSENADGSHGNITDSLGWLRGMPAGSLSSEEIDRIFTMLGSKSSPELPGGQPDRLGLIVAIKNFTRDTSQNVDDPTLPVNPAYPPKTLVLLRSVQAVQSINYDSWHKRGGIDTDHSRLHIESSSIPTAIVLFGSFELGDSDDVDMSLDSSENLDFLSRILDSAILNIVDLFLDVGTVLNTVPGEVVSVLSGGVTGSSSLDGRKVSLLMSDDWTTERQPLAIDIINIEIGSSPHPILPGDHVVLAEDQNLEQVMGEFGPRDPIVPVAASIHFSGLISFVFDDNDETDNQFVNLQTDSINPLTFTFIEHSGESLNESSYQSLSLSDIPNNLTVTLTPDSMTYSASSGIEKITYLGLDADQRQGANIHDLPAEFTMVFGERTRWRGTSPISTLEIQISNSTDPITMSGDHFLFDHDPNDGTSSISARLTGLQEVGWIEPIEQGASGPAGRGTAFMTAAGDRPLSLNVNHAPTLDYAGLTAHALIDPMPSTLSAQIPTGGDGGSQLDIPEFNMSNGMSGVAFFIGGFADLGRSVNSVLAGFTSDISTGSESNDDAFSYGMQLEAQSSFDIVIEAVHGEPVDEEPPWVHGISFHSSSSGISEGFHLKAWLPGMPSQIDMSITRSPVENGQDWALQLGLDGWIPARQEFMVHAYGINGQDLLLTLQGLDVGESTSLFVDTTFEVRSVGEITEVSTSTQFSLSERLDWVHAMLVNRESKSRTEMLITDIPEAIALQASIGDAISLDMSVPDMYRRDGSAVGSIMLQQMQWLEDSWWPATVFLTDVPGYINLTTEPDMNFDITKNLAFQGTPVLDFSASDNGMSLYIEAFGRAINSRGDMILLAEGMTDRMIIKPTSSYGLAIRSGGVGVEKLYVRMTDVPVSPPIILEEMEAMGENIRSATIHVREIIGPYSVIEIEDVDGGRIIVSARASAHIEGYDVDLRGVMFDAQMTGGIPTGTTLGVNGLASDLSLLNMIPGFSGSTHHLLVPEPLSSGILTILATTLGGG
jgi:hypothetical protein